MTGIEDPSQILIHSDYPLYQNIRLTVEKGLDGGFGKA